MEKRRKGAYNVGRHLGGYKLRFAVILMIGFVWAQQVELPIPPPPNRHSTFGDETDLCELFDSDCEDVFVVFAIDRSASMKRIWEKVVASAESAISELPPNAFFNIVLFSSACEGGAVAWRRGLVVADARGKAEAMRWLGGWRPAGCSVLLVALKTAFSLSDCVSVFLVADDYPNTGETDAGEIVGAARRLVSKNGGRLNTILVSEDEKAAELLAELAHCCGGSFRFRAFVK